jgi:hypothetical protein
MSAVQLRPTFRLETELGEDEVIRRIHDSFSNRPDAPSQNDYQGQFASHHAMISILESKRQFWSPWMHLEIRNDDQHRIISGRFSPHPSIWTGFMFAFGAIACLTFFAAMFGVSQQLSGQTPWAYYAIPLCLLVATVLWFVSKTGQTLARDEMERMRSRIESCLND